MFKTLLVSVVLVCFIASSGCARFGKGHQGHNKGTAKMVISPSR